jgi:hypothetical protein
MDTTKFIQDLSPLKLIFCETVLFWDDWEPTTGNMNINILKASAKRTQKVRY